MANVAYDRKEQFQQIQSGLLEGEQIIAVYDAVGTGTGFIGLTDRRVIIQDRSFVGKRYAITSIPYSKITSVSVVSNKSWGGFVLLHRIDRHPCRHAHLRGGVPGRAEEPPRAQRDPALHRSLTGCRADRRRCRKPVAVAGRVQQHAAMNDVARVTLRPMDDDGYERFLDRSVREYAEDKVRSGEYAADVAVQRSAAEFGKLLPEGLATPDTLLFTALNTDGVDVGVLWLALPSGSRRTAFVFELWVGPEYRGRGYGRAIMLAGEQELAARGVGELGLNVFGHNPVAIGLYESLGYRVTTQQMSKQISAE